MSGQKKIRAIRGGRRSWRPLVRLAVRDLRSHALRTAMSVALVALAVLTFVGGLGATADTAPSQEAALASIPAGVEAVVTATAVGPDEPPMTQSPQGLGIWQDDLQTVPASAEDVAGRLSPGMRLLPYWRSPDLLIAAGVDATPGVVQPAGAGTGALRTEGLDGLTRGRLHEADAETLALLLPPLRDGSAPSGPQEAVVSADLADRLHLGVGSTVTVVAPPFNGWYSTLGRIGEAIQGQQKSFRVSGVAATGATGLWARDGWISAGVQASPRGIDRYYLAVGAPVTWNQVKELNGIRVVTVSRHVLTHFPADNELYQEPVDVTMVTYRVAVAALAGVLGAALVLSLLTPAFMVSTGQQRRLLGLATATGATPSDLRRLITTQGVLIGLVAGVLGIAAGVPLTIVVLQRIRPGHDIVGHFPWWWLPLGLLGAVVLGYLATANAARWAARQEPVAALKGRPTPAASRRQTRQQALLGPTLLVVSVFAGAAALLVPLSPLQLQADPAAMPSRETPPMLAGLMVVTVVAGLLGLLLSVAPLVSFGRRVLGRASLPVRTAMTEAAAHPARVVPAVTTVLVATMMVSGVLVGVGSMLQSEADESTTLAGRGHLVLGSHVPVSDDFDRAVLLHGLRQLEKRYAVRAHEPIRVATEWVVTRRPVPCPEHWEVDTRSALEPGTPQRCVPYDVAYRKSSVQAWWVGQDTTVLTGAAARLTGMPGAEQAAAALDAGGVVVPDATMVAPDGTVEVQVIDKTTEVVLRSVRAPGVFVPRFGGGAQVLSPAVAERLALLTVYAGEVVELEEPIAWWQREQVRDLLAGQSPLVWPQTHASLGPWESPGWLAVLAGLVMVALLATAVSVVLARTQQTSDLATMSAVGASPGFLRRYLASQTAVILLLGAPTGVLAGVGLASWFVAWNRRAMINGAWRQTVIAWPAQAGLLLVLLLGGLALAVALARTPDDVSTRMPD